MRYIPASAVCADMYILSLFQVLGKILNGLILYSCVLHDDDDDDDDNDYNYFI